ncbi:ATP-binding protein [Candidatus Woesearchaeota archaeon]|jgi:uncharacterized protein|nr:ATP-binding protein [Candidatus Woesearchaeota archaeon]MBT4387800.1 ATP-binding protein [Candidatus Woesearchaeota archaeon]MBT4595619.1 ATP-binding protein [Candidatus Woesearchaeota archaeon]MBT5740898.1 ATP-binding protein [Candidatus Woesearchaeota archaeon]MBT6505195.1 ATP-binding protein [Candidatus Woesearchaeota archaeon]
MIDIVVGRSSSDKKKWGKKGTVYIGKSYIKMGHDVSLANPVYLDVSRAHQIFVVGKRGTGKSYTMGVIAEGMIDLEPEISQNLSIIMLDTMGIYWTMKYPNKKEESILKEWGVSAKPLNVNIYCPIGFYNDYKKRGIPVDVPFAIKPKEMEITDWAMLFKIDQYGPIGIVFENVLNKIHKITSDYDLSEIIKYVKKEEDIEKNTKLALTNLLENAINWGIFDKNGTDLISLSKGGQVSILDVSAYATVKNGWEIKSMVIGLVAKKLFNYRMISRKYEEFEAINQSMHYFTQKDASKKKQEMPMVWLIIDEAHEFLPVHGKTLATDSLITILREGRQPGISMILATQQPGKIHTDVLTQSDTVISHRITAKIDTDALGTLMQSYMRSGLDGYLNELPKKKGASIIFDDNNERMYPMQFRPRFTWHGGEDPVAIKKEKKYFE